MSQVMKVYTGLFLMLLIALVSGGILGAYMNVANAQDLHARIITELECADYHSAVVEQCYAMAEQEGCFLEVDCILENGNHVDLRDMGQSGENCVGVYVDAALVRLHFPFRIPFLGIEQEHVLSGYAR